MHFTKRRSILLGNYLNQLSLCTCKKLDSMRTDTHSPRSCTPLTNTVKLVVFQDLQQPVNVSLYSYEEHSRTCTLRKLIPITY